jgi:Mce-associated membrane protein
VTSDERPPPDEPERLSEETPASGEVPSWWPAPTSSPDPAEGAPDPVPEPLSDPVPVTAPEPLSEPVPLAESESESVPEPVPEPELAEAQQPIPVARVSLLGRLRTLAPVIAAGLCIPCAVLLVIFLSRLHSRGATDDARGDAAGAARTAAIELLAYDYRHIAADVDQAQKLITKPFSKDYAKTTASLKTEAVRLKAIVQADVKDTAIEDATSKRVVVLLFVDQASVKQLPGQTKPVSRVDEQRVRMTMVHMNGRWLVSELAVVL